MSEALAFDTHRFVKNLTANGFTEEQAEVLATEQVNILNSNLATKVEIAAVQRDIENLRQGTQVEIAGLGQGTQSEIVGLGQDLQAEIAGLRRSIKALKVDLLEWLFGAMIAQTGLIVALIKLL